jgi:hypothetical protein
VDNFDPLVVNFETLSTYSRIAVMDVPLAGVAAALTDTGELTVAPELGEQMRTPAVEGAPQVPTLKETVFLPTLFNTSTVEIVSV